MDFSRAFEGRHPPGRVGGRAAVTFDSQDDGKGGFEPSHSRQCVHPSGGRGHAGGLARARLFCGPLVRFERGPAHSAVRSPMDPLFKLLQARPEQCKLGCGWLPLPWRDTDMLAKAIRKTARSGRSGLVEYGDIHGYLPLRKQLSLLLRQSTLIQVSPQQILTTLGATQALDLISRTVIRAGDHVLVDEPCSSNLIKLIRLCGGIPVGVPRLADGPDVAVLDRILQTHKVRAFFCNSTFHNPTAAGLSPKVAFEVLKRAAEHDFSDCGR